MDGNQLPDELLEEILARLPARSVGRFRCVSRAWATTLSSASFVDLHLQRANPAGQPKVFLVPGESSPDYDLYGWQAPGGDRIRKLKRLRGIQPEMLVPLTKPCRGLVLLRCPPTLSYYVCNPSIGAILPVTDTRLDLGSEGHVAYGLGYSAAAKEYKLVRLFCFAAQDGAPLAMRCEVLVLDASAHWRPSAGAGRTPVCGVSEEKAAVFVNGRLHFAGQGGAIVTFDVTDETFGVLKHPADLLPNTSSPCLMTELGGCLCVSHGFVELGEPCTLWLLRDYEAARWEKLCCIDQTAWPDADLWTSFVPVEIYHEPGDGSRPNKIMFMTNGCKIFEVDLEHDAGVRPDVLFSPDNIEAMGGGSEYACRRLGLYEESLVMPGRTNEEIIFSSPLGTAWSEVLKRLPATTVARLNLVCRDWRAMISTDRFVHSHAVHAQLNKPPRIMFGHRNYIGRFTDLDDFINEPSAMPPLMRHGTEFVCSQQSCLGLAIWGRAIRGRAGLRTLRYVICNPSMGRGELRLVLDMLDTSGEGEASLFAGRVGLGYDTEMNKHTLVYLSYSHRCFKTREYKLECSVQNIHDCMKYTVAPPRPVVNTPPVNVDGKLFWLVDRELGQPTPPGTCCEIVAMDNRACRFEVLRGPPCRRRDDVRRVSILELRGALCVACAHRCSNRLEIWAMRGSGGGGSWSVEHSIDLGEFSPEYSCDTAVPLAVDPGGRILLSTGRSLGWYDPRTRAMQTVYSLGERGGRDEIFVPVVVHESLFRPDGLRQLRPLVSTFLT